MKVFLVPNYYKNEAVDSGLRLELWLNRQGAEVVWAQDQRSKIVAQPDIEGCDLVISLGGDGTLLRAARIVGYREIPILGLSYGHVGFLTAASPSERDVISVVSDALAGELHVSRRATLDVDVVGEAGEEAPSTVNTFALNDLALTRGPLSDMVEFDITVSGHHIDRLRGDGVVVSTATGSTGYALSAGGPVVAPSNRGLLVVPIAVHALASRPIVTGQDDWVDIDLRPCREGLEDDPSIQLDGELQTPCQPVDRVRVRNSALTAELLRQRGEGFYKRFSNVFLMQ